MYFLDTELFYLFAAIWLLGILLGLAFGWLFWGWGSQRLRDEIDILTEERDDYADALEYLEEQREPRP